MRFLLVGILSLLLSSCGDGAETEDAPRYFQDASKHAVFFLDADNIALSPSPLAWHLPVAILRENARTGTAMRVDVPSDTDIEAQFSGTLGEVEVIVLSGEITLGGQRLGPLDYARMSQANGLSLASLSGARMLVFQDPQGALPRMRLHDIDLETGETTASTIPHTFVLSADSPWVAGTAMAEAGRDDVPLKIKHYKNDPVTGARTYLVSVAPGVTIPWESHKVAEEAYVLEGDYTLAECLADGKTEWTYGPGGYFYRPPGIAHNGPVSGTKAGTIMLIRTPAALTVDLVEGC